MGIYSYTAEPPLTVSIVLSTRADKLPSSSDEPKEKGEFQPNM